MIGFDKLNDMQKKAVLQTEGPVLILEAPLGRTRCARPPDLPRSPSYRTQWRPMHPISLQRLHSRCSLRQRKALILRS